MRRRQGSAERQYHEPDEHLFEDFPHDFPFRSFIAFRGWQDLCWADLLWRQLPEFRTGGLSSWLTRFCVGEAGRYFGRAADQIRSHNEFDHGQGAGLTIPPTL